MNNDIVDDLVTGVTFLKLLQDSLQKAAQRIHEQDQRIHALQKALGETLARELAVAESWDGAMYDLHAVGMVDIGQTLRADLKLEPKNG